MKVKIGNRNIFFAESVLENLHNYKQTDLKSHEAGGILLGQIVGEEIFVLKNSEPCRHDKSSRFSFLRDKGNAQIVIDLEFGESGGKTIYLGEWHTHPEDIPTPSFQDLKMVGQQFNKNKLNEPFVLLVIQGRTKKYVGIYDGKTIENKLI